MYLTFGLQLVGRSTDKDNKQILRMNKGGGINTDRTKK